MDIFLKVFFVISLILIVFCLLMLLRNERVYHYRSRVIAKISNDHVACINTKQPYTLSWDILEKVSYNDMVIKFWRSFDSFFPPEYRD